MMRHVRKLGLVLWGLLLAALPQDAAAIELTENLSLNGYVHYEHFSFIKNTGSPKVDSRNEVAFHTEWIFYGEDIKAFVAPEFRFDGSDEVRNDIFLDEAWIDYYSEYVDFRIGKQIISWGETRPMPLSRIATSSGLVGLTPKTTSTGRPQSTKTNSMPASRSLLSVYWM